jgi:hypothetical protein
VPDPSAAGEKTGEQLPLYAVRCRKASGEWRNFGTYREPGEAAAVAARLRQVGACAEARVLPTVDIQP